MEYFQEHDKTFKFIFLFSKYFNDIFLIIGIVEGLYSTCGNKYIQIIVACYSLIICFIFHSIIKILKKYYKYWKE